MPGPLHTADNVRIAYELRWSIAIFWNQPALEASSWLDRLKTATEPDGVRVLEHRLAKSDVSQFLVSTKPNVTPANCLRAIKGRLQYLIRTTMPKAFKRNYSIISVGTANRDAIESYVADQLNHHPMADPRVDAMLLPFQFADAELDLCKARRSSYGEFIFNLHLVAVHDQRYAETSEEACQRTFERLQAVARKKQHLLSGIGLLADHVHWTIGCGVEDAPLEVGLSYLNNMAHSHGMRPLFQCGFFAGTFGTYDMNAVRQCL